MVIDREWKKRGLGRIFRPREAVRSRRQRQGPARTFRDFRVHKVKRCSVDSFSVALIASYIHIQAPFTSWPHRVTGSTFSILFAKLVDSLVGKIPTTSTFEIHYSTNFTKKKKKKEKLGKKYRKYSLQCSVQLFVTTTFRSIVKLFFLRNRMLEERIPTESSSRASKCFRKRK